MEGEPVVDADGDGGVEAVGVMLSVAAAENEETGEGDALTLMLVVHVAEGERVDEMDALTLCEPETDDEPE